MANITIGGILIKIGASTAQLDRDLKRAEKAIQNTANKFKNIGTSLTLGLTTPILAAGAASFKLASDLDESLNKVRVAFGDSTNEVENFAKTTLKTFGIARGSALDMAATFGDMATSLGLPRSNAAALSTSLVGLAGDLASFKNININEVQTALSGIFTGETESLKRLGIVMTETNLSAFALSQGLSGNIKEFTQAEKVTLRYNYILANTKNAQGDFARTSGGAANQMRIFQESLKEVAASFGSILLPVITPVIKKVNEAIQAFGSLDEKTKKNIITIAGIAAAVGPVLIVISKLISGYGAMSIAMVKLTTLAPGLASALSTIFNPAALGLSALIIGIGLVARGFQQYNDVVDVAAVKSQALNDVNKEAIRNTAAEFVQIDKLVKVAANETKSKESRIKAIKELQRISPLFNKSLTDETIFTDNLTNAQRDLKTQLLQTAKAKAAAAQIGRLSEELVLLESGVKHVGTSIAEDLFISFKNFGIVSGIATDSAVEGFKNQANAILTVKKQIESLSTLTEGISLPDVNNVKQPSVNGLASIGSGSTVTPIERPKISITGLISKSEAQTEFNKISDAFAATDIFQGLKEKAGEFDKRLRDDVINKLPPITITPSIDNSRLKSGLEELSVLTADFSSALQSAVGSAFELLGNTLANLFTGDAGAGNFFTNLLSLVGDFAQQLGKAIIGIGLANLALKTAFANPFAAIAAGTALVALGGVVKNLVKKGVPSLAIGTDYVNQDGLAYLHKGEAVVPANVASNGFSQGNSRQELYGRLSGIDLLLSNKYAYTTVNRLK